MSKVIKIKQKDIEKIVSEILEDDNQFDDFDTQKSPEELPGGEQEELTLGQDAEGNYFVFKNAHTNNPEIVAKG